MVVLATAVWRVRPSGNNLNGGGYDPGIGGAATDYSRQNAAQATGTNGSTTGAGATTFTDATAGAFTSVMVGNCIQIASGTNFQAGWYFVTAFTNANSVVLDRTPTSGGAGSAGVWKLGGGWADFWTNTTTTVGPLVPGNIVNILGSGTPNPAAYSFDYTANTNFTAAAGNQTAGQIVFQNDPSTPGYKAPPDTTGGMPCISITANDLVTVVNNSFIGLWLVATTPPAGHVVITTISSNVNCTVFGCVIDQFGHDNVATSGPSIYVIGSEIFSSVAAAVGAQTAVNFSGGTLIGCNVHDTITNGVAAVSTAASAIINNIVAKCGGVGIFLFGASDFQKVVMNNTIDGNGGNGIECTTQRTASSCQIINNIISNHTVAGKFGLVMDVGTAAQNSMIVALADYNVYYNNTANYSNINAGPHDTALGVTPYVGQATENYKLA